jgi:hypothetical protein
VSGISGANSGYLFIKYTTAIVGTVGSNNARATKLELTSRVNGADILYPAGFATYPYISSSSGIFSNTNMTSNDVKNNNLVFRWRTQGATFTFRINDSDYTGTYPADGYYATRSSSNTGYVTSGVRFGGSTIESGPVIGFSLGDFSLFRTEAPSVIGTTPAPENPGSNTGDGGG